MIIVAGSLCVAAADREAYLAAVADVARLARNTSGCLDFIQAADPLDPERINIFERWESDVDLDRFRTAGGPETETPPLTDADVHKYRISGIEEP